MAMASPAFAPTAPGGDSQWHNTVEIYLTGPNLDGSVSLGPVDGDVDVTTRLTLKGPGREGGLKASENWIDPSVGLPSRRSLRSGFAVEWRTSGAPAQVPNSRII
jgi:hypothetical protein